MEDSTTPWLIAEVAQSRFWVWLTVAIAIAVVLAGGILLGG